MSDLRKERDDARLTQRKLAALVGTPQSYIADLETGTRVMGVKMARRLGRALKASPDKLLIGNRIQALKRAIEARDPVGVLDATTAIVEAASRHELTPSGEQDLDELVQNAVKFASKSPGLLDELAEDEDEDAEDYGDDPERDFFGRRIKPFEPNPADYDSEGRDWLGRRVVPLDQLDDSEENEDEELDDDEDNFEDEDYGDDPTRDFYGRVIREG